MIKSLASTALFALALVPGTAAAQPVPISTCNYRITEPGQYVLAQDLICSPGFGDEYGIRIDASDVDLRMDGHTVENAYIGIGVGFQSRVTIHGPGAVVVAKYGVWLNGTTQSRVTGITVAHTNYGIEIQNGADNILTANTVGDSSIGFEIEGSNNILRANRSLANGWGIRVEGATSGNIFQANVAQDSTDTYDILDDNTACLNTWVKNFFGTTNSLCVR